MRLTRLTLVAAIALAAACGSSTTYSSSGAGGNPPANEVWMQNIAFNPTTLTVTAGTTVTWTNKDAFAHTVTYSAGPGTAFSGSVAAGATFQHTFATAGTYQYYCTIHGTASTGMHATVVAQ